MQANRERTTKSNTVLKVIPILFEPKIKYPKKSPARIAKTIFIQDILLSSNMLDLMIFLTILQIKL